MTPPLTFFELFAGVGGMSMGLELAGWSCVGHAEWDTHPRAVLRYRWPDVPLHGDVSELHLALGTCTLLTGGSPCQDLSVAGKRAGMTEGSGTRSSLFFEQMRLWQESGAPYCLWENVLGAFSSNKGNDFGAVLTAFVGAAVPVPADGWRSAGVASGPAGVAAWRVLDARYFGVPQRRRRVFILGARTGGVDPAAVLSLAEGVSGDFASSRGAGEGTAADAAGGARSGVIPIQEIGKRTGVSTTDIRAGVGIGGDGDPMYTLQAGAQHGILAFDAKQDGSDASAISPTLLAAPHDTSHANGGAAIGVVAFKPSHFTRGKDGAPSTIAGPLSADADKGDQEQIVLAYQPHGQDSRITPTPTLHARAGTGGGNVPLVMSSGQANAEIVRDGSPSLTGLHEAPIVFAQNTRDEVREVGGGVVGSLAAQPGMKQQNYVIAPPVTAGAHPGGANAMRAARMVAFGEYVEDGTASTIKQRDYKDATDLVYAAVPVALNNDSRSASTPLAAPLRSGQRAQQSVVAGRPRRLMPVECERLQGWPDGHTAIGTDEHGTTYPLSDSARYKACGNGCCAPVIAWIAFRLRDAWRR